MSKELQAETAVDSSTNHELLPSANLAQNPMLNASAAKLKHFFMKRHIVTNWENDMIDTPEEKVSEFVNNYYKGFELNILSGLRHRTIEDIYETLKESFVIIMQPSLLDEQQVRIVVSGLSHWIWGNFNSNVNDLTVRHFIFLSSHPFDDFKEIINMCRGLKDSVNEPALVKIVKCISCHFYGFDGEHYELRTEGYHSDNMYAVRHK